MGILGDNKGDQKGQKEAQKDEQKAPVKEQKAGYSEPLFEEVQKWNDDRMVGGPSGESMEVRHHDKENVLKVTKGLCHDIFFRAEDVNSPDFEKIPDFAEPVPEQKKEEKNTKNEKDYNKPLDSPYRKRSYLLDPDQVEEKKPQRLVSKKRSPRKRTGKKPTRRPRRRR